MTESKAHAFTPPGPSASTTLQLHKAALLSPPEVDVAFKNELNQTRALVLRHWMLTAVVSQVFFDAMRLDAGRDVTGELAIIRTPAGAAYLIICSELDLRQHRHVLPLYDRKVKEFLTQASREPFRMFVESASDNCERFLYTSPLFAYMFVIARDVCKEMDPSRFASFVHELPQLMGHVTKLDAMRSIKGGEIREVNVSILLPYQTALDCLRVEGVGKGRSAYCH